jgi:pimeloyl-ACP methyl ester carboxylesterase
VGEYLELGTQRVYYEEHGSGFPLFLLHGGGVGADIWQAQVPAFAAEYRVFVPERRGHGRTPDVPGPYTTENMAAETAAVIEALAEPPVHIVGWSDGAYVAAHLAVHRSDLVSRVVLIGQAYERAGETRAVREFIETDAKEIGEFFRQDYEKLSPDGPEHFPVMMDKLLTWWRNPVDIPLDAFAHVTAPTLVLQGDDDGVRFDYSASLVRTIPDAQFAVVPGASHGVPLEKPEIVNRLILDFLRPEEPRRFVPLGSLKD